MAGELFTRTITTTSANPSGVTVAGSVAIPENEEVSFSQLVPALSSAVSYAWAFAHTTLQAWSISAVGGAATVAFYNASTPLLSFALANGQTVSWNIDEYNANSTQFPKPFASDVTSIKVTCTPAVTITGVAGLIV